MCDVLILVCVCVCMRIGNVPCLCELMCECV